MNQKKLLFLFCVHLYGNRLNVHPRGQYCEIIYQEKEISYLNNDYDEDVAYLIDYQRKHGCYPPKFQQLFNEWLLMRM